MAFRWPWNREQRSALSGLMAPQEWLAGALGATPTTSGQRVTVKNALGVAPVWSAVSMIAEQVGQLPLNVYKLVDGDRVEARSHRAWRLLHDQPNEYTPADRFWSTVTVHLLLYGNAFIRKHRDSMGLVDELVLMNPAHIIVFWDGDQRIKQFNYQPLNGQLQILGPEEVIHIYGLSTDGVIGESVIGRCKNAFGVAMARDEFEGGFYRRGAALSGVVEAPRQMSDRAAENVKASVNAIYGGSNKAFQIGLLEEGATFKTVGSPLKDIMFVEAQQMSRTDIAVMFKLPPNYLGGASGDSLTYATVESNQIQFALHAIAPWTNTIAKALAADPGIFPQNAAYDAEFDIDCMLRADAGARADFYQKMAGIRAMTRNEIRRREDLPPVPGGDTFDDVPTTERITSPSANPNPAVPPTVPTSGTLNGNGNGALPQGASNGS